MSDKTKAREDFLLLVQGGNNYTFDYGPPSAIGSSYIDDQWDIVEAAVHECRALKSKVGHLREAVAVAIGAELEDDDGKFEGFDRKG